MALSAAIAITAEYQRSQVQHPLRVFDKTFHLLELLSVLPPDTDQFLSIEAIFHCGPEFQSIIIETVQRLYWDNSDVKQWCDENGYQVAFECYRCYSRDIKVIATTRVNDSEAAMFYLRWGSILQ